MGNRIGTARARILAFAFTAVALPAAAAGQGLPPSAAPGAAPAPVPVPVPAAAPAPVPTAVAVAPLQRQTSIGLRVGGYGFRDPEASGDDKARDRFDDRKMGGAGVFVQHTFGRYLFGEAGADFYKAEDPAELDQRSTIVTAAAGLRTDISMFTPYVQIGAGLEFSEVRGEDWRQRSTHPVGFAGVGGEIRLGRFAIGLNIRAMALHYYERDQYEPDKTRDERMDEPRFETALEGQILGKMRL